MPQWESWKTWAACMVSCGNGTRSRTRDCSLIDKCSGENMDVRNCQVVPCQIGDFLKMCCKFLDLN